MNTSEIGSERIALKIDSEVLPITKNMNLSDVRVEIAAVPPCTVRELIKTTGSVAVNDSNKHL